LNRISQLIENPIPGWTEEIKSTDKMTQVGHFIGTTAFSGNREFPLFPGGFLRHSGGQ
jgi:hypothetical protein